jgi:hypothetical protein
MRGCNGLRPVSMGEEENGRPRRTRPGHSTLLFCTGAIRSFESIMGHAARRHRPRKSLSDRLASMPGPTRLSGPQQQATPQTMVLGLALLVLRIRPLLTVIRVRHCPSPHDHRRFFLLELRQPSYFSSTTCSCSSSWSQPT